MTTSNNDTDTTLVFLVWQSGTNGPYATIEYGRSKDGNGKPIPCIHYHLLTEEEKSLSLSELMLRYPEPASNG